MRLSSRLGVAASAAIAATAAVGVLVANGVTHTTTEHTKLTAATAVPAPSHVVVVMEENHSYDDIIGSSSAPYINSLASGGALLTSSYGVTHPSEPNYMALFGGSTAGLTSDACPVTSSSANLGSELIAAGKTFTGYSEDLPSAGSTACTSGKYARKHSPWINYSNLPTSVNQPYTAFPSDYSKLPTVSFVIPNLNNDMHDGSVATADSWLKSKLSAYATWAKSNNSLLVVTWDEDDYTENNKIPTIFYGAGVKTGKYSENVTHYNLLATLEQMYGLPKAGSSSSAAVISDIWN